MNININLNEFVKQLYSQATQDIKRISLESGFTIYFNHAKLIFSKGNTEHLKSHLKHWYNWLITNNIYEFNEITQQTINSFILYSKSRKNKNITINKRITMLIRIMKYLANEELLNEPNISFKRLKEEQVALKVITEQELIKLLEFCETTSKRNKLILLLLISTGIRRSELVRIHLENIDYKNNRILLTETKSHKSRYIFITDEIKELIKEESTLSKNYLFDIDGEQMSANAVSLIIKRIRKRLNIENLAPHRLRHTYATYLLKNGCDIESVRRLLGHSTLLVTQRYLDFTNEELQANNDKFNPLNINKKKS